MNGLRKTLAEADGPPLLGMSVQTYDPIFVEIIGRLGFQVLWIEMEHAFVTYAQAADLCRTAAGVGLLAMIRIPDHSRENVLKAAECGPDTIILPMCNSLEILNEFVTHARFPPVGDRGFYSTSRAANYGAVDCLASQQWLLNETLNLMIEIETVDAVEIADQLCAAPTIEGVFVGLGDLSISQGVPGELQNPGVVELGRRAVRAAKDAGKVTAASVSNPEHVRLWSEEGIDLVFCGSNLTCVRLGVESILESVQEQASI